MCGSMHSGVSTGDQNKDKENIKPWGFLEKKKKKDGKRTEDVQEISNNCTVITVQTNSIKIVFVVWA